MGIRQLKTETVDLSGYQFGDNYTGKHRVWTFEFEVEFENLYLQDHDAYATLKNDFAHTPVILGLDETTTPPVSLFYTNGASKNIYFISASN
jgi:hypothetical protein